MSEVQHTPGPWHTLCKSTNLEGREPRITVAGGSRPEAFGGQVAVVGWKDQSTEEAEANARLIAAAPDLLAACEESLRLMDAMAGLGGPFHPNDFAGNKLRAAIAAAREGGKTE
jgi:hypothetical protein